MPRIFKRHGSSNYTDASKLNFTHGVASGDPYSDSVILWTRVAPAYNSIDDNSTDSGYVPLYFHGPAQVSTAPICVEYKVATDQALLKLVSRGRAFTSSDIDYTVKVEARHLRPFTQYYYQFNICGSDKNSTLGRTKTAPRVSQHVDKASLAVYSCGNYPVCTVCILLDMRLTRPVWVLQRVRQSSSKGQRRLRRAPWRLHL